MLSAARFSGTDSQFFPAGHLFNSENKALRLDVFSFSFPHHACFHLSWLGFFVSFVSTFAAAPMTPIIREVRPLWQILLATSLTLCLVQTLVS
jgi:hypothetical protein